MNGLILSLEEDVNITINTDDTGIDQEVEEASEDVATDTDEINTAIENTLKVSEVAHNLIMLQRNINMFGITREFLHLVNGNGNFNKSVGVVLPYYEDDGALGDCPNDKVTEIDIPEEAEIEMAMEGLLDRLKELKDSMVAGYNTVKIKVKKFITDYITLAGRWHRKLDAAKKQRFSMDIDEAAFNDAKLKTYKLRDLKQLLKTVAKDLKSSFPTLTGKEYNFEFCKDSLGLLGYRTEVYTKELLYLGEKIPDLKGMVIKIAEDNTTKIVKIKESMHGLGWTWRDVQGLFNEVKSSLDLIKPFEREFDRVYSNLMRLIGSLTADFNKAYRPTYDESGQGHLQKFDLEGKKALYLLDNVEQQYFTFIKVCRKVLMACIDIVSNYYNIINRSKPITM